MSILPDLFLQSLLRVNIFHETNIYNIYQITIPFILIHSFNHQAASIKHISLEDWNLHVSVLHFDLALLSIGMAILLLASP